MATIILPYRRRFEMGRSSFLDRGEHFLWDIHQAKNEGRVLRKDVRLQWQFCLVVFGDLFGTLGSRFIAPGFSHV